MSRKLTRNSIKPVIKHVQQVVSGNYYHFTLDTYQGKNSFQGGTAHELDECYTYDGTPFDEYAINRLTGEVIRLSDKEIVMTVEV